MKRRHLIEMAVAGMLAVTLAVCIRIFLFQIFVIPSRSMESTLCVDDSILIFKGGYRFPVPFSAPAHGDIVVFSGTNDDGYFVKRVIAVAGDTVDIRDGAVRVNGRVIEERYARGLTGGEVSLAVPRGQVFVMGDNRAVSEDSRVFGTIAVSRITGRAFFIFRPIDRFGLIR